MLPTSEDPVKPDTVVQLEVSCAVLQRLITERGISVCELRCLSADSRQRVRNIVKDCAIKYACERKALHLTLPRNELNNL